MRTVTRQQPHRSIDPNDASELSARMQSRGDWKEKRVAIERSGVRSNPAGPRPFWRSRVMWRVQQTFGVCLRLCGLYRRGVRNALDIGLASRELSWAHLPSAFDGYRILQISDTHFDTLPQLGEVARSLLAGLDVDLIVLSGDFRGGLSGPSTEALAPLWPILGAVRARDGRLAVLGNHDSADVVEVLEAHGIRVLLNESVTLERNGQRIVVTGLDDVHHFFSEEALQALDADSDDFKIALVHSAEVADFAAQSGYDFYLCGHTHGGQVCWPGGRPIVSHMTRCFFGSSGLWRCHGMVGYTSRGLGVASPPVRFNCRGETTLITLRKMHT